jgi:hypothetical protein
VEVQAMSALAMWTVYDHPKDYPDKYVARRFDAGRDGPKISDSIIIAGDLETLRTILAVEMHLTCIPRDPADDPVIVEIWL